MSEEDKRQYTGDDGTGEDPADTAETAFQPANDEDTAAEEAEAEETQKPATPEEQIEHLEGQVAEMKDKALRAMAEAENVRRRAEREREETSKYAITNFARDLLSVADNLRRAIDSLPDHLRENEELNNFLTGVEMTEKELLDAFEKHGIVPINPEGEKFDHNYHQAMFEVESHDQPPGTVVQVVQTGYMIKDRLLRPAMVGVAKAPSDDSPGGSVDTSA